MISNYEKVQRSKVGINCSVISLTLYLVLPKQYVKISKTDSTSREIRSSGLEGRFNVAEISY